MSEQHGKPEPLDLKMTTLTRGEVEHALNGIRLAVLGLLVSISLSVGFGVPGPFWVGPLAGLSAFVAACVLIRLKASRKRLMTFMHWLTEQ